MMGVIERRQAEQGHSVFCCCWCAVTTAAGVCSCTACARTSVAHSSRLIALIITYPAGGGAQAVMCSKSVVPPLHLLPLYPTAATKPPGFGGGREREEREPSRADSTDDWGAERKFVPSDRPGGSGGSGGFGGGFRDRDGGGGFGGERRGGGGFGDRPPREDRPISEADTVDDWGANRKYQPAADTGDRRGGFGGGFKDRERPAGAPRFNDEPSRADSGDWGARRSTPDGERPPGPAGSSRRGYGFSDQPMSQADVEDKWSHRGPPAGGGEPASAPAERPRLKLAPRTLPLPEQQQPQQQANGAASSPRGSEAGSSSSGHQQEQKVRKSNPFGEARPREEVLKEKGIDYQKEELKLEHGEVLR